MSFRFKQFSVEDDECTMKVGTDSVLLGAWANLPSTGHVLDVGTGCGLLALMVAQRSNALITAIDIDEPSITQAQKNFTDSPWDSRIKALVTSFQQFALSAAGTFDLIITNPPYFANSLKAPHAARSNARHNDGLPFAVLAALSFQLLQEDGRLCLILPIKEAEVFTKIALNSGFYLTRQLSVTSVANKPPNRLIMEFTKSPVDKVVAKSLTIRNETGSYTNTYKEMTKAFYLDL